MDGYLATDMEEVNNILVEFQRQIQSQLQELSERQNKLEQKLSRLETGNGNTSPSATPLSSFSVASKIFAPSLSSNFAPKPYVLKPSVSKRPVVTKTSFSSNKFYTLPRGKSVPDLTVLSSSPSPTVNSTSTPTTPAPTNNDGLSFHPRPKLFTNPRFSGGKEAELAVVDAAKNGRLQELKALLDSGVAPNAEGPFGHNALYWAVRNNNAECVQMLLRAGAKVEDIDYLGKTSLHRASVLGHTDCILELLQFGAVIEAKDKSGNTALHDASSYGHTGVVQALLQFGANIDETNEWGETALMLAVCHDNEECVRSLVSAGADKGIANTKGQRPMDYAKSHDILQLLKM